MNHKSRFRSSSYTAVVQESDQKRLKQFALHELAYYNTLIESLESRARAFSKQVAEITDTQIDIICACVNGDQSQLKDLPSWLQFVVGQITKPSLVLIPSTKKLMTKTMIEFFRDQAQVLKDPILNEKIEQSYKVTAQNISKQDSTFKRHVQIPRSDVKIKWDVVTDSTHIQTPLTAKAIQVPGINLNEHEGWQMLVIRQEPGRWVHTDTPWQVEFRHTQNQYLIKLVDIGSNKRPT